MSEVRVEKGGFTLYLGGTWMEISNKYGVLEHGDVAVLDPGTIPEGWAEKRLDQFIEKHKVVETHRYIQLQAVYSESDKVRTVQKYDDEFVYIGEIWSGCEYPDEVKSWMHDNYQIESGLTAYVLRDGLGDCTNGGISSARKELYIMTEGKYPFEPDDLRQCVGIEFRDCCGETYVDAKPLYFPRRWYMAGGNFLYTRRLPGSATRYRYMTGTKGGKTVCELSVITFMGISSTWRLRTTRAGTAVLRLRTVSMTGR